MPLPPSFETLNILKLFPFLKNSFRFITYLPTLFTSCLPTLYPSFVAVLFVFHAFPANPYLVLEVSIEKDISKG